MAIRRWVHPKKGGASPWTQGTNGIFTYMNGILGGGIKYFVYFHPYLGKISHLTDIFQMG